VVVADSPDGDGATGRDGDLDADLLRSYIEIDPSCGFLQELVNAFTGSAPATLVQLGEAVALGDAGQMGALAHRLKGGTGAVGIRRATAICAALEELSRAGSVEGAATLVEECRQAVEAGMQGLIGFTGAASGP
jgi:HPt (histidine-containing phosphotransfer) domain-containing protein